MNNLRWCLALLFWLLALMVLIFNIRRQKINRENKKNGITKQVSGVPFLLTISCLLGVAASPLPLTFYWWGIILLEIPALIDFTENTKE